MKRLLWLFALAAPAVLLFWAYRSPSSPPAVAFTQPRRETIASAVSTNGKVEPGAWRPIHAEVEGRLLRLPVQRGDQLAQGAVIAEIDSTQARAELAAAEARIAAAKAELTLFDSGGRERELAEIRSQMDRARLELAIAQRERDALLRLVEKQAATRVEVEQVKDRIARHQAELEALEQRRRALVSAAERAVVEARLREAEQAAALAQKRIERAIVRAPIGGVLYQLDVHPGAFLRPGDLIGRIGTLERMRVLAFVDEPELGSVRVGQPVTITWDAAAGKQWQGMVERLPPRIEALNARQVGQLTCIIENKDRLLIPETNVNVEIRTGVSENALTLPREAVRRDDGSTSVFVLLDAVLRRRPVRLGIASATRVEVLEGIRDGDWIALPGEVPLRDGMRVQPRLQPSGATSPSAP